MFVDRCIDGPFASEDATSYVYIYIHQNLRYTCKGNVSIATLNEFTYNMILQKISVLDSIKVVIA